tara:strand:- start:3102 stop:3692 length:591 start_codon:yes stop_codon:yes gene_type:complete
MESQIDSICNGINIINLNDNIINRGTGAGGAKTNRNGLSYEQKTDLSSNYNIIKKQKYHKIIHFNNLELVCINNKQLFKYMKNKTNNSICKAHGCKQPDECYIDENNKVIFIIEKKFQQTSGSVCEKLQTPDFKLWQYKRTFPEYKIVYIYCLSDWFKKNCIAELEYLEFKKVPVFWGNDLDYKNKIISFIINYTQ